MKLTHQSLNSTQILTLTPPCHYLWPQLNYLPWNSPNSNTCLDISFPQALASPQPQPLTIIYCLDWWPVCPIFLSNLPSLIVSLCICAWSDVRSFFWCIFHCIVSQPMAFHFPVFQFGNLLSLIRMWLVFISCLSWLPSITHSIMTYITLQKKKNLKTWVVARFIATKLVCNSVNYSTTLALSFKDSGNFHH